MTRPTNDGIIDEIAIARTFAGDAAVGARLTPEERDEVLRRAGARIERETQILEDQRVPHLRSHGYVTRIGPEVVDGDWKLLLSQGLGFKPGAHDRNKYNSLTQAIGRLRQRDAA